MLIARICYPNCPPEVARGDAHSLTKALEKRYTARKFYMEQDGDAFGIEMDDVKDQGVIGNVQAFVEGFMASSHLWER